VHDSRGIAPKGWHVPSDAEWTMLTDYLGGQDESNSKMKVNKNNNEWVKKNTGSNESGFTALPGGYRRGYGPFDGIGVTSSWWSATETNTEQSLERVMNEYSDKVERYNTGKGVGIAVRCIKN
jgi:uncharacterized protein (TIGR02145 family)